MAVFSYVLMISDEESLNVQFSLRYVLKVKGEADDVVFLFFKYYFISSL